MNVTAPKLMILLLTLFITGTAMAQSKPLTFSTEEKVAEAGSKEALFRRAQVWLTTTYAAKGDTIQTMDERSGKLLAVSRIIYQSEDPFANATVNGFISFRVLIQVSEGQYSCEVTNFNHQSTITGKHVSVGLLTDSDEFPYPYANGTKRWSDNVWLSLKERSEIQAEMIFAELKTAMIAKGVK